MDSGVGSCVTALVNRTAAGAGAPFAPVAMVRVERARVETMRADRVRRIEGGL
jgi:hypothetical protein